MRATPPSARPLRLARFFAPLLAPLAAGLPDLASADTPNTPNPKALTLQNNADQGAPPNVAASADIVAYPPAFFAEFAPRSALDMVRRVPGFAIDDGDERRGFSGTGGNVLIDGERPSAKSQGVADILARIPADQVARIDLIRGAQSTEAAGQSQVINVVRRQHADAATAGLYELTLEMPLRSQRITASGQISTVGRLAAVDYSVGLNRYMEQRPLSGIRFLSDGAGAATGTRRDDTPRTFRELRANATLSAPLFDGKLNINAEGGRENFRTVLESVGFSIAGARTNSTTLKLNYRTRDREIGADWERTFGGATLKVIGLDRRSWEADDDDSTDFDALGIFDESVKQRVRNREQESIARATISFAPAEGWSIETGGEIAFNALDAGLELFQDTGVGPTRIALPSANVRIEEDRGEAFARAVWAPMARMSIESSLAWETSTISQSGDADASRTLSYWKPSLQIAQGFGAKNQWRVRLFRDVGQLDFEDFSSSVDLADVRVAAGNPDLAPDARITLEAALDWRWGENGAVSLAAAVSRIEDVVDRAPIVTPTGVFDAPANIGDADFGELRATLALPIDAVLPGALIEAEARVAHSSVTDPVTGRKRALSGLVDWELDLELRQDIRDANLAWGMEIEANSPIDIYRLNEREIYTEGPDLSAFVETTALPAKVRLYAVNLLDTEFERNRNFFAPTRAGAPSRRDVRQRSYGRFIGVVVSGKF